MIGGAKVLLFIYSMYSMKLHIENNANHTFHDFQKHISMRNFSEEFGSFFIWCWSESNKVCRNVQTEKENISWNSSIYDDEKGKKKKNKLSTEYCWYLIFDNDSDGAKTMFLLIETHWALSVLIRWQATERERHIDKHGQNRMLHEKRIVRYIWTWNVFRLIISQWAKTMHRIERVNAWWCSCAREKAKMYFYNQKAFVHVNG